MYNKINILNAPSYKRREIFLSSGRHLHDLTIKEFERASFTNNSKNVSKNPSL